MTECNETLTADILSTLIRLTRPYFSSTSPLTSSARSRSQFRSVSLSRQQRFQLMGIRDRLVWIKHRRNEQPSSRFSILLSGRTIHQQGSSQCNSRLGSVGSSGSPSRLISSQFSHELLSSRCVHLGSSSRVINLIGHLRSFLECVYFDWNCQ